MPGGPYYGDPEAVKLYNRNIKSLDVNDFDTQLDLFDSVASVRMLADLYTIFVSIPPPTSRNVNVISVLWLYAMTEEIQSSKSATARTAETGYQQRVESQYDKLLREIKSGEKIVPGAIRTTSTPQLYVYTPQRVQPSAADHPITIADTFPHGLRH